MIGVASGTLSGRELIEANKSVYADPEKTLAIVYQIHDYRNVAGTDITSEDIRALAALDMRAARINPNIVVAVVHSGNLGFGLSRMWESYMGEYPFISQVFRSMEEARAWLAKQLDEMP